MCDQITHCLTEMEKVVWKERQTSNLLYLALSIRDSCIFLFFPFCRYHKSQAIYLESKENTKISCVISSVGANEVVAAFICQQRGGKTWV